MTGIELAVGYAFAWAARKAKRVAGRVGKKFDAGLDAATDKLCSLIGAKLGVEPALRTLEDEAAAGRDEPTELTRKRVELALQAAVEGDEVFARALERAVADVTAAGGSGGVRAGDGGITAGTVNVRAEGGSFASGGIVGNVTFNPRTPDSPQG